MPINPVTIQRALLLILTWALNLAICAQPAATQPGVVIDKIVAKVDNQIILKSEYDLAYIQMLQAERTFDFKVTPCKVLEQLLTNKMLLAKAETDSVEVDDKQVENEMNRRMEYFIAQIGSKEKLEAYYNKTINQLKAELRKQVKEQMTVQKMQDNITAKIKVTPGEVKRFFNEIPKDSLPYFSKEYEIGHIVKLPSVNRNQKYAARTKLENIRKSIVEDGVSFQTLAKKYSEDPISAREGGELGFFKKGDLVPEYEAAALKLKPGEISPVFESIFGFHIVQMIERRGNDFNTRHILIKPQSSESDLESAEAFLDSIRTLILKDSLSFEKAAKLHSDDKFTKDNGGMLADPDTRSTKISAEDIDPTIFFQIDTLKPGSVTRPMPYRTEDGKEAYRIIYFKSVTEPHVANLKDDYQKIQAACLQEKKNKAVNKWFNQVKSEVFIEVDREFKDCDILKGVN